MIEITVEGDDPHLLEVGVAIHRLLETNGVKVTLTVENMDAAPATPVKLAELDLSTAEVKIFLPDVEEIDINLLL